MKNIFKLIFCLLSFFTLVSCIKPAKDVKEINIITLLKDVLDKLNWNKDKPEEQRKYFENIQVNFNSIINLNKDTSIYVATRDAVPGEKSFAHTLSNNRIIIDRPIYITFETKNLLFSFDNKTWYLAKSDPIAKIEGIQKDYYFDTKIDKNDFFVDYWMSFSLGRVPKIIDISKKRKEMISLKKGKVFASFNEEIITDDLTHKILYIPEGVIISWKFNLDGNIVKTSLDENGICLNFLRDIYIYCKKKLFSLSFDKENWNVNILSFDVKPELEVKAIEENQINFNISVNIDYQQDKIFFSLIKVLFESL